MSAYKEDLAELRQLVIDIDDDVRIIRLARRIARKRKLDWYQSSHAEKNALQTLRINKGVQGDRLTAFLRAARYIQNKDKVIQFPNADATKEYYDYLLLAKVIAKAIDDKSSMHRKAFMNKYRIKEDLSGHDIGEIFTRRGLNRTPINNNTTMNDLIEMVAHMLRYSENDLYREEQADERY